MDIPGVSMFAGAGSLHLNSSAQERLDEQEEREDQERRNKELQANLLTAFDDLVEDDEPSSVNCSRDLDATRSNPQPITPGGDQVRNPPTYIESLNHLKDSTFNMHRVGPTPQRDFTCNSDTSEDPRMRYSPCGAGDAEENLYYANEYRGHLGQHNSINSYEAKQQMLDYEQLKMMYEMRVKECQQLANKLAESEHRAEEEADSLRARLTTTLEERDQAQLSLQQCQRLQAKSKQQLSAQQQEIIAERERADRAATERERANMELHAATLALQQAQQQLAAAHDSDKLQRRERDRISEDCERLREDLEKCKSRLAEKEQEVSKLTRRYDEVLVEKGAVVSRLANELEAAQCRLAGGDTAQAQIQQLGSKLERTAQELVSSRKECARIRQESEEWKNSLQKMLHDAAPDIVYANASSPPSKFSPLRELISRYKQMDYKIQSLTEEINTRDAKIESCHLMENELRRDIEERRANEKHLTSRVASIQKQLETLQSSYRELESRHGELKARRRSLERSDAELDSMTAQNKDLLRENGELKSLYLQVCSARDGLSRDLQESRNKLNALQKERDSTCDKERDTSRQLEREREESERLKKELEKKTEELEEVTKRMDEQQKEYANKQKDLADKLYKYIKYETVSAVKPPEPCGNCEKKSAAIAKLEANIQQYALQQESQECNELLLKELRSKAEYFEKYILERFRKLQEQRHVATNTDAPVNGHADTHQNTQAEEMAANTDMMMKEKNIREQFAEKYTLEIKTIELNCNKRISELQKESSTTISKLKELLETKAQEVDVLKKFVVSERSKVAEVLRAKEFEINSLNTENKKLEEEFRELREKAGELKQMLEKSHAKNSKLKADLEKRSGELEREKERSSKVMSEMADQLRTLDAKAAHVESQHDQLKDKYRNVKKTALVYKEYATKKDAHVESELERIKSHYEAEVARLHEKLQQLVKTRREIQVNERISKMQSDFDAVVSEVNSGT